MFRCAVVVLAVLISSIVSATSWLPGEKTDPLSGDKVEAHEVASYGSYVYQWPSKYDMVFWPLIDEKWIGMNPANGYAAFNDDFEKLTAKEREKVSAWLKENYDPSKAPATHEAKLAWLEQLYAQRDMDDLFWSRFYRLMAYLYHDKPERSMTYVRKAIPKMETSLKAKLKDTDEVELLFALGEYARRLGDTEKALDYFDGIAKVRAKNRDYVLELVKEQKQLLQGTSEPENAEKTAPVETGR